ncbi:hypothetical protein F5887DRAFT_1240371 [Amanita rubescens]|nr:hypothetical protein F5887DRAFT_1240371 [Amanita rubescens]
MVPSWLLALSTLLLSIISVAATGGFPPVVSPPGACGLDPADASCATVFDQCVNTLQNKSDPYSNEACVAAASCYPTNPDSFLSVLFCRVSGPTGNPPRSANIPRVNGSIASQILVNGSATYESYAKWYTGVVSTTNSNVTALIDIAFVKMSFDIILAWTGFCSTGKIPEGNLIDWFQWFSSVQGPSTTCGIIKNCPLTYYPYTMDLTVTCAKDKNAISNPFSIKSCVAAGLNWQDGIDSFLEAVTCRYNLNFGTSNSVPASNNLPALSFDLPVANPPPYTQQNFVDFTYGQLSAIGTSAVRWPSTIEFVTRTWTIIVAWTNFCLSGQVPQKNLSDLLKYSHVALTSTTCTCPTDPSQSCAQLFNVCLNSSTILTNPYADRNCVLAATCYNGGVKAFGNGISCAKNTEGRNTDPQFWPRLTESVFNTIGKNGVASQQNYIDAFYGALAGLPSPIWPSGVSYVAGRWTIIKDWTAFPTGNVPYKNFADWTQYS